MNKKKWGGLIGVTCVVIISFIGLSNANYASKDEKTNKFQAGHVDIEIQEVYTAPEKWTGEDHIKNVSIKNKSNVNTLLRAAIVPRWVDENGAAWAGDASCVDITYAKEKWIKDTTTGYYYYNEIVKEEDSTKALIESVKANIPTELQERYKGKKLIIDVKAETVIAKTKDSSNKYAFETAWSGINDDNGLKTMLTNLCN